MTTLLDEEGLARRFEEQRPRLRSVAYRMLGSLAEAEDAVQEAWLRLARSDAADVRNFAGWLTTVVSRLCLDTLRARTARHEVALDTYVPDPLIEDDAADSPEQAAIRADEVGLALMIVLDSLSPSERVAFVLHDLFALPFDAIAQTLDRSPAAAKQLASRARRRLADCAAPAETDSARRREVVEAFHAAACDGDFDALVAVLDPDVLLRVDGGEGTGTAGLSKLVRGADTVAAQALTFSALAPSAARLLVNGTPGFGQVRRNRLIAVMDLTISGGRVVEINILADLDRLKDLRPADHSLTEHSPSDHPPPTAGQSSSAP